MTYPGGQIVSYEYDDIGRLDRHTLADFNITTLAYNPASQIVTRSVTDGAMQSAMPDTSPSSYTPNNLNQYGIVDGSTLDYDPNGNLEDYDTWTYGYDAHNRLTSASRPGTSVTLGYDPTGRLSETTLAGATTLYAYAGDKLIGEFTPGGNPINLYIYPPGSDTPIARFSGSNGLNDLEYLRSDERGSIVLETDGTALLESHQYDVYGVPLNPSDSLFRYTGQIQIRGTDLYHYKARAYHPNLGRFLQTDPIGYDDGMNMYAYVGNDPVNYSDPNGDAAVSVGFDAQGSVLGFGIGLSGKVAVSLSREQDGSFRFQMGGTGGVQQSAPGTGLRFNDNMSFYERAAAIGAAILDTGASGMVEVGGYVGTAENPADVEDLGGESVEIGGTLSKKALGKAIGGPVGSVVNAAPGPAVSGELILGEDGIMGLQVGAGAGAGATMDIDQSLAPIIPYEKKFRD